MVSDDLIEGAGTGEEQWLPHLARLDLPVLRLTDPPPRAVVVAPHPDDEILGVGGLLALLAPAGTVVEVVAVTNGEASNPGGSLAPKRLARVRMQETRAALGALGVPARVRHLHLPDGGAAALEQPVFDALHLEPGTWLIGPWSQDGHPDHDAVGRACATTAARDGARLLAYPVWAWHWAATTDPCLPWPRARQVPLPARVRAAKAGAVAAFDTQVRGTGPLAADAPVLPPHVLARFARPYEVVFT